MDILDAVIESIHGGADPGPTLVLEYAEGEYRIPCRILEISRRQVGGVGVGVRIIVDAVGPAAPAPRPPAMPADAGRPWITYEGVAGWEAVDRLLRCNPPLGPGNLARVASEIQRLRRLERAAGR